MYAIHTAAAYVANHIDAAGFGSPAEDLDGTPRDIRQDIAGLSPAARRLAKESAGWSPTARVKQGLPATLARTSLALAAPSIFAEQPWHKMSGRYKFIPTTHVLDIVESMGFLPVQARQSKTRIEGKSDFTRHAITLRHRDTIAAYEAQTIHAGEEIPQIILTNSHDGASAYELYAALERIVCLNGLMVNSADLGTFKVRHSGGNDFDQRVIETTWEVMDAMPTTAKQIGDWKQIQLTTPQQEILAASALELRDNERNAPAEVNVARRMQDQGASLWNTFNRVQENTIKGGLRSRTETGRRQTTRPVQSVTEDTRINRALWRLTEEMARLAS